jgi:cytochrome o ubiquinol oxidase subunit 2
MKKYRFIFYIVSMLVIVLFLILLFGENDVVVLHPKGWIGLEQRNLFLISTILMSIVVVPVFIMTFVFAWKYRENNPKGNYRPDFKDSVLAEIFWWSIPLAIIAIMSIYTWHYTHKLDPFKPLSGFEKKPITVQVVALQWKWLFIYPDEKIASVNYLAMPLDTPINFELTADAPMNSFWLPELGGQVFAMPAMKTELKLIANEIGTFSGYSANISGKGFAGMIFTAESMTDEAFNSWIESVKKTSASLDTEVYKKLAMPSEYNPEESFILNSPQLFEEILMKYMMPHSTLSHKD